MTAGGPAGRQLDVLIVSLGSTEGLRRADQELYDSIERAGASVELVRALAPAPARTLMLTDLAWARAARCAASEALTRIHTPPTAIVYSSITAALLWPRPGAIRFDALCAGNRHGRHGLWQRPLERRRLAQSTLLLPWSDDAMREVSTAENHSDRALVLPMPVEPSGPLEFVRDIDAITYAANPSKKGLDRVLAAWRQVRTQHSSCKLVVAGATTSELERAGFPVSAEDGVRVVGQLPSAEYRALVRRARVFVCAPRREDYGIAQLEALSDGCMLVSTPAPGPYVALPVARALDGRLVSDDLAGALHCALADPRADYQVRALEALAPFRQAAGDRLVAERLLPRLLANTRG